MSRISYRNYPILEQIKKGELSTKMPAFHEDILELQKKGKSIYQVFKSLSPFFKTSTIKVSESFLLATDKAKSFLVKIMNELGDETFTGTIIIGKFVYCYYVVLTQGIYSVSIFDFYPNGGLRNMLTSHDNSKDFNFYSKVNNSMAIDMGVNYTEYVTYIIMSSLIFKKYASVEIIESKAKSKNTFIGCKYLNETDLDIEYLDSKWFTTLTNVNGFKVRGFFRLQPKKKDGEWTKELIWIDDFEKKGYNRKAKKLYN